ncbi:hypothetical protein L9F63_000110, partial [Diploptera punctata]
HAERVAVVGARLRRLKYAESSGVIEMRPQATTLCLSYELDVLLYKLDEEDYADLMRTFSALASIRSVLKSGVTTLTRFLMGPLQTKKR